MKEEYFNGQFGTHVNTIDKKMRVAIPYQLGFEKKDEVMYMIDANHKRLIIYYNDILAKEINKTRELMDKYLENGNITSYYILEDYFNELAACSYKARLDDQSRLTIKKLEDIDFMTGKDGIFVGNGYRTFMYFSYEDYIKDYPNSVLIDPKVRKKV